jgi:hypothetical protein
MDLAAAGLQLVETAAVAAPTEAGLADSAEQSAAPRRRRGRGGRGGNAQAAPEALVMVETRNEPVAAIAPASAAQANGESPSEWGPPSNPRRRARPKLEETVAEPLVMVETKSVTAAQNTVV